LASSGLPQAPTVEETDWTRVAALYDALARVTPSPVVELNRAVAYGMAFGAAAGLDLVDGLTAEPSLRDYHLLPSVCGDLLVELGRLDEARTEFERAAALTRNARRAHAASRAGRHVRYRGGIGVVRRRGQAGAGQSRVLLTVRSRWKAGMAPAGAKASAAARLVPVAATAAARSRRATSGSAVSVTPRQ